MNCLPIYVLELMESRKNQFLIFTILLFSIGLLQYFRKIVSGYKLSKVGKILYLATMLVFTISIMILLYHTELNNLVSFGLGLTVTMLSEHIAKLFMTIGNNFEMIIVKIIKKSTGIDLKKELTENKNSDE